MLSLGINSASHDSSIALVRDGEILFAAAEERFSRAKHDRRFPAQALAAGLRYTGISAQDVDHVGFGWNRPGVGEAYLMGAIGSGRIPFSAKSFAAHAALFGSAIYHNGGKRALLREFGQFRAPMQFVDHHEAHAWSAYSLSGMPNAAVLVIDGHGAWQATSIYAAVGGMLKRTSVWAYPNSLGSFYTAFTDLLGFESDSDEWKLMGLAAYGEPTISLEDIIITAHGNYRVNKRALRVAPGGRAFLESRFGKRRRPDEEFCESDKNLAASVQKATEDAILELVRRAVRETGHRSVCLAGGVAMNSKANGKILASGLVDDLFVQPAATDDGTAVGAAFAVQPREDRIPRRAMRTASLGPDFPDSEIEQVLRDGRIQFRSTEPEAVAARLLADGYVIGWFQGRMEFGPRALGNRSILADPRDVAARDRVNASVKFREEWRPFAPSCLAERAREYFEPDAASPFMILTFHVRDSKQAEIPAVTHADQSARVQTVERDVSSRYWKLLDEFANVTGVPVLMNTSFNLRGEPIVCKPSDAIRTFYTSGLDFLVMGNCIVAKDDVRAHLDAVIAAVADRPDSGVGDAN